MYGVAQTSVTNPSTILVRSPARVVRTASGLPLRAAQTVSRTASATPATGQMFDHFGSRWLGVWTKPTVAQRAKAMTARMLARLSSSRSATIGNTASAASAGEKPTKTSARPAPPTKPELCTFQSSCGGIRQYVSKTATVASPKSAHTIQISVRRGLCGRASIAARLSCSRATSPRFDAMSYAIISLGGKQYRVREGERLLVDRLPTEEGKTFHPEVLMLGGDGKFELAPKSAQVTAKVVGSPLGEKIRIGKYRPKSGYRRHTGFRAKLSQIEIQSIGGTKRASTAAPKKEEEKETAEAPGKLPSGYADMTVKEIAEQAGGWSTEQVAAALEYERAHAKRKGALAALEAQEGK